METVQEKYKGIVNEVEFDQALAAAGRIESAIDKRLAKEEPNFTIANFTIPKYLLGANNPAQMYGVETDRQHWIDKVTDSLLESRYSNAGYGFTLKLTTDQVSAIDEKEVVFKVTLKNLKRIKTAV